MSSETRPDLNTLELEPVLREEGAQMALLGHLALIRFTTVPPRTIYTAYRRALDAVVARDPARAAVIHIAEPSSPKLDRSEMIAEFQQMMPEYGESLKAVAVIVVSRGFMSSALRSMISTSLVLTRPKTKIRLFGELGDACSFIASETGASARYLERTVTQFREGAAGGR